MTLCLMYAFTGTPFCFADCTKENTFEEENKKVIAYLVVHYIYANSSAKFHFRV